jgi:hypothetical protein
LVNANALLVNANALLVDRNALLVNGNDPHDLEQGVAGAPLLIWKTKLVEGVMG